MAISKQKKMPSDDSPSGDSLSFAGLVCTQDQKPTTRTKHVLPLARAKRPAQGHKQDVEFEFSRTMQCSSIDSPTIIPSSDLRFTRGQFRTKATPSHEDQFQGFPKRSSNLLPPSKSNGHRSNVNEPNLEKHATRPKNGASDRTDKKQSGAKPWFRSFVTPCRDCHAQEPTLYVNEQVLRR